MTLKINNDTRAGRDYGFNRVRNKQPQANEFLSNQKPVSTQIDLVMSTEEGPALLP